MSIFTRKVVVPIVEEPITFPEPTEEDTLPNTPDLYELEQRENHLLFHYGQPFRHVDFVSYAFTREKMQLWQQMLVPGTPPVALRMHRVTRHAQRARIGGRIYVMPTEYITELDKHMDNGYQYKRKRVPVLLPITVKDKDGTDTWAMRYVWMYQGLNSYWQSRLEFDGSFYKRRNTTDRSFNMFKPAQLHKFDGKVGPISTGWFYQFERKKALALPPLNILYKKGKDVNMNNTDNYEYEPPWMGKKPVPADEMTPLTVSIDGATMRLHDETNTTK